MTKEDILYLDAKEKEWNVSIATLLKAQDQGVYLLCGPFIDGHFECSYLAHPSINLFARQIGGGWSFDGIDITWSLSKEIIEKHIEEINKDIGGKHE